MFLRRLIAFAFVCTAIAACDEARAGFMAPELSDAAKPVLAADTVADQPEPANHRDDPSPSLEKLVGMSGQTASSPVAGGGLTVAAAFASLPPQVPPASERLWLSAERASPCLGFRIEILRPPRV